MNEIKGHIFKINWDKLEGDEKVGIGLIIIDDNNQHVYICGYMKNRPYPELGNYIVAKNTNGTYKRCFKNNDEIYTKYKSIEIRLPIKQEHIFKFIDNLVKHVKPKLNANDINYLINNNENIWENIRNKNLNYGKIKQEKINTLYNNFANKDLEYKDDKEFFTDFLINNNISLKKPQIDNLFEKYTRSEIIISTIINNLIELSKVDLISINTLIHIATALNFSIKDKIKLTVIHKLSTSHDTCIIEDDLIKMLLKEGCDYDDIKSVIDNLLTDNYITRYKIYLYYTPFFNSEYNIGNYLKDLNANPQYLDFISEDAIDFLDNYTGNRLNNEQQDSFLSIFKYNVNITVGPAGAGKSEILIRLCNFIKEFKNVSVLFLAPTGKACDRLTKGFLNNNIDNKAFTIQKFSYYNGPYKHDFIESNIEYFNNIITNKYKIFVIDEMSMVSLQDFNIFIDKIKELSNCILFILGDTNQLPSVSCGDVLNNLVISNSFNIVRLTHIYRSNSLNLLMAQNNLLEFRSITDNFIDNDNSFIWIKEDPNNEDFVLNFLQNHYKNLPFIITSTNKTITNYQDKIKNIYNTNYSSEDFVTINCINYHIDDQIIIKTNDYEKGLMNGMIGKIYNFIRPDLMSNIYNYKKLYNEQTLVGVLFDGEIEIKYLSIKYLETISLAYLITIHKSQGSEANIVVVLLNKSLMNTINLLYTAITRTKKQCILISEEDTIKKIIEEKTFTKRISNLKDFCK